VTAAKAAFSPSEGMVFVPLASKSSSAYLLIEAFIDLGDFCDPALAFSMLHRQNLSVRPVKVIGNIGYLLVQPL
jgi:hypothetical protein